MGKINSKSTAPQEKSVQKIGEIQKNNPPSARQIHWTNFLILVSFHVLAVVALFYFSWQNLLVFLVLSYLAESLGIGIGYHRLLTHRSFKAPKWLEYFLTTLGTLAIQNGAVEWVTTHRIHH